MYSIIVESGFSATHQLRLPDGTIEPLHGHDWRVRVHVAAKGLDDFGMVLDFEAARRRLEETLAPLHHANLSDHPGLRPLNATAEVVARFIYDRLAEQGVEGVRRVEVTEAPGCVAVFEPDDRSEKEGVMQPPPPV